MIHIKEFKLFESNDDTDTMAMYQLHGGDSFISFNFRDLLIKDKEEIINLIEIYKDMSEKDGEWIGGPVSRIFDEYFIEKYRKILGDIINFKVNNPWKPSLGLTFYTDYGFLNCGFSFREKKMISLYSNTFDLEYKNEFDKHIVNLKSCKTTNLSKVDTYSKYVIHEMHRILNHYYKNKSTLSDLIEDLSLDIDLNGL
jgi:hypothetical protein